MDAYIFHEGPLSSTVSLDFEPALFNTAQFLLLQTATPPLSFYAIDQNREKAIAAIHFHADADVARSPFKAPFGSFDCSEKIRPQVLYEFLAHIEAQLRAKGMREIYIKNPPRAYDPENFSMIETFLMNQDYVIAEAEVGAVISVSGRPFSAVIRHSEQLRKSQANEAGLRSEKLSDDALEEIYNCIADCHNEKKYRLSISYEKLRATMQKFPGKYLLFAVKDRNKIIAASVSIRVKQKILYNFLVNHEKVYNSLSPPVLLMESSYNYCQENGIGLLDLGTSALDGKPHFSLLDFKSHMGGLSTSKFTFHKRIA